MANASENRRRTVEYASIMCDVSHGFGTDNVSDVLPTYVRGYYENVTDENGNGKRAVSVRKLYDLAVIAARNSLRIICEKPTFTNADGETVNNPHFGRAASCYSVEPDYQTLRIYKRAYTLTTAQILELGYAEKPSGTTCYKYAISGGEAFYSVKLGRKSAVVSVPCKLNLDECTDEEFEKWESENLAAVRKAGAAFFNAPENGGNGTVSTKQITPAYERCEMGTDGTYFITLDDLVHYGTPEDVAGDADTDTDEN